MDQWCGVTGHSRGEVITLEKTWELAQGWYWNRMQADYRGRTKAEAQQILEDIGLTGAFWRF